MQRSLQKELWVIQVKGIRWRMGLVFAVPIEVQLGNNFLVSSSDCKQTEGLYRSVSRYGASPDAGTGDGSTGGTRAPSDRKPKIETDKLTLFRARICINVQCFIVGRHLTVLYTRSVGGWGGWPRVERDESAKKRKEKVSTAPGFQVFWAPLTCSGCRALPCSCLEAVVLIDGAFARRIR